MFDIDFNDIYLTFSKEEDPVILKTIAASIHEAFQLMTDEDDSQKLRDTFKNIIEMNNRDTISVISENLDLSLMRYCNKHAVEKYAPLLGGVKEEV